MWKPAAIGGLLFGILGGLPIVGALNCACCALIIGGGFLAAYLHSRGSQSSGVAFGPGDGALVGLAAAPFYALASTVIGALLFAAGIGAGGWREAVDQAIRQTEDAGGDTEAIERFAEFLESAGPFLLGVLGFGVSLLLALVFSTIGGLIGGAAFKYTPPPAAPPTGGTVPPPPPPSPGGSTPTAG